MRIARAAAWAVAVVGWAVLAPRQAAATALGFEQLNWFSNATGTLASPYSPWGQVHLEYTGAGVDQFFNLAIQLPTETSPRWVVQNMGLGSLYGDGVSQVVRTFFDLGTNPGGPVTGMQYAWSIDTDLALAAPNVFGPTIVDPLDFQIGGEGGVDLGNPPAPAPAPADKGGKKPVKSAKLPNIDKFVNQPQKKNECAPGAISNSLKYLQATGKLGAGMKSSIAEVGAPIGTDATGTPQDWPQTKREKYKDAVRTTFVEGTTMADLQKIIDAVNAGKDVELDLNGHVAVVAGVRVYENGTVELDLFDDNQTDDKSDPLRTTVLKDGKVDGMGFDRFVIEEPVPEPATLFMLAAGAAALARRRRRA